jgi:uncharacterized RDD family membrane protein YckC
MYPPAPSQPAPGYLAAMPPGYQPGTQPPGYPVPPGYYLPPPRGYVPIPLAPDGRPLAGFGDRLLAFIVDALIMGAASMIFFLPALIWWFRRFAETMTTLNSSYDPADTPPSDFFADFFVGYLVLLAIAVVSGLLISYVYLVEMAWKSGQTIGKRIMKLQVAPVDAAESRSRMMFVKRWAVERLCGLLVPFFEYLDGLWQLWDKPLQQCLHDKAARTVVVKIG